MGAKSKSTKIRSAAGKRTAKAPARRGRRAASTHDRWEQSAQVPEVRIGEIDCQRIVQNEGGRSLPLFYDDYN